MLPGEHEELQAGTTGICSSSPQAPQVRWRENHDAHRLSARFRVRPTAADINHTAWGNVADDYRFSL